MLHMGGAAALVEGFCGELSSACHCVAIDPSVELNHCGLGVHRSVSILYRPMAAVEKGKETPVELET